MRRKLAGKNPTDENPKSAKLYDPQALDQFHVTIRNMLRAGEIHEHDYFQSLINLAARWLLLGRREDAVSLLCELTPEYMEHGLPFQMKQDELFKRKAFAVASYLAPDISDVSDDDVALATMLLKAPVAKA